MEKRCKEAGEEVIPITPLEKIACKFHNAYDNPASKSSSSSQEKLPPSTSKGSSRSSQSSSCGSYDINTDDSSKSSTNPGSENKLPPKVLTHSQLSKTVDVARGKNPLPEEDDNFDDFSYEDAVDDDYNSYNFSEQYKERVGQYIVELRQSVKSTESYCSLKYLQAISEHHLIREAPFHFKMC